MLTKQFKNLMTDRRKTRLFSVFICLCTICILLSGCSQKNTPKKTNSLDFTIVSGSDIPKELKKLIKERKESNFELTYSDKNFLYVIKGYGKQRSGGYSIVVDDFYQSKEGIVLQTTLYGPKKGDSCSLRPSYPYIVLKTEYRKDPVIFQ